jgi:hypothetical protein
LRYRGSGRSPREFVAPLRGWLPMMLRPYGAQIARLHFARFALTFPRRTTGPFTRRALPDALLFARFLCGPRDDQGTATGARRTDLSSRGSFDTHEGTKEPQLSDLSPSPKSWFLLDGIGAKRPAKLAGARWRQSRGSFRSLYVRKEPRDWFSRSSAKRRGVPLWIVLLTRVGRRPVVLRGNVREAATCNLVIARHRRAACSGASPDRGATNSRGERPDALLSAPGQATRAGPWPTLALPP